MFGVQNRPGLQARRQVLVWSLFVVALLMMLWPVPMLAEDGDATAEESSVTLMEFQLPPQQSLLRAEAGLNGGVGQVLSWHPDLDEAHVADGFDYIVDGTIYRWNEEQGASVWYNDSGTLPIDVIVPSGTAGTLRLYIRDWTHEGRVQVVEVEGVPIGEFSDFTDGLWVEVPVTSSATQDEVISLAIRRLAGPNPILQALEFVPAPVHVVAGLAAPHGQVLQWSAEYDVVEALAEGYGYAVAGTIYRWDDATAVWYDDSGLLSIRVTVPEGITGILALYLHAGGRDQNILIDDTLVGRYAEFGEGQWVHIPVTEALSADGVLDVTVELNAGANPVVNGMQFLPGLVPVSGDAPTSVVIKAGANAPVSKEPVAWSATLDDATLPIGYRYSLVLGEVQMREDGRSAWVEPDTIQVLLEMSQGQEGTIWLFMQDFDGSGRVQTVLIQGRQAATVHPTDEGIWLGVPVTAAQSSAGVVGVAIRAVDGPDAVLSELHFDPVDQE